MRIGQSGVEAMILKMIEPRLLMRVGLAASILGHLVLTLGLIFADAHPFESMPSEAITVDIVAPEDAKALPKPADEPKPADAKQPDPVDLSALTAPAIPTTSPEPPGQKTPRQKSQAAAAPPSPPPPPPPAASQQTAGSQQAAAAQQVAAKPQGTEALQPTPSPQASSQPPAPEPDVTVKYGVMLGLPSGEQYSGVEAPAYDTAKIAVDDIAAFRRHLKTCSSLPPSVAPTDKIRIVLRVLLSRDGMITEEPALLEASASAKGPILMQKAISALQACQPYTMLPVDKYKQWKELDLSFTPQDFTGG
jgi:outer membrane biosynthesis protein TonB